MCDFLCCLPAVGVLGGTETPTSQPSILHSSDRKKKENFDVFLNVFPGAGELSVFCQSYFNKTLIGQAGSIGRKARQEVGVE